MQWSEEALGQEVQNRVRARIAVMDGLGAGRVGPRWFRQGRRDEEAGGQSGT